MLTPGSLKESLDTLPDGVCFFEKNGQPLLVDIEKSRWREIALVDVMIQIHPEKVWFLDEDGV